MPNHKFDRDDRQKTLGDLKYRIIDLIENPFVVPETAWDEEPVRYFKLNLQWCKILAGWLEWMENVAGWADAEDDLHAGIQGFLEFEKGINGTILMTPDEFRESLRDGMYEAFNNLAKQIVSGRITNIAVGDDGSVSDPTTGAGDADLPDDDPATVIDEELASKSGGAIAVRLGFNELWGKMNGWYTAGASLSDVNEYIKLLYDWNSDAEAEGFAFAYYGNRDAANPFISSFASTLDEALFCQGHTIQTLTDWALETYTATQLQQALNLAGAIAQSQLEKWFNVGLETPSTIYQTYYCAKQPSETVTLDMSTNNAPSVTTSFIWKKGHRLLIHASGTFVDSDQPGFISDALYAVNDTGGRNFVVLGFNSGGGTTLPTATQCPYQASHTYEFTIEKSPTTGTDASIIISKDNGTFNLPGVSGVLTITITDLGYFGI